MLKLNKKGETEGGSFDLTRKSVFWIIAGAMLVVSVFVYAYFLGDLDASLTYVSPKVYAEAISQRFVNLPECFAYQDPETGRVYQGIIDLNKFNQTQMEKCYQTDLEKGYEDYNFRILLKNKKLQLNTNNYFNADEFTLTKTVLVKENNSSVQEELVVYVQASTFKHEKIEVASG